jgi:hypothetical protein
VSSRVTASTLLPSGSSRNAPVVLGRVVARPGLAVAAEPGVDAGPVEGVDEGAARGEERDVQAFGVRRVVGDDREVPPLAAGARKIQHGEDGVVEALRGGAVGDADRDVVEHVTALPPSSDT